MLFSLILRLSKDEQRVFQQTVRHEYCRLSRRTASIEEPVDVVSGMLYGNTTFLSR